MRVVTNAYARISYLCLLLNGKIQSISSCLQFEHGAPWATILHRTFLDLHVAHALEDLFFPLRFEIGRGRTCGSAAGAGDGKVAEAAL
jgi:hypothetical protein